MTNPADLVQEACDLLAGYMGTLELLVAEPSSTQDAAAGMSPRPADTPEPWDAPVGRALMDGHEGVRRLEAVLKYMVAGHPGARRGGSTGNTMAALDAIPRLAAGVPENVEAASRRYLEHLINGARRVRPIDEAEQWRYVRGRACPHCGCFFLRVLLDAAARPTGRVECHAVGCVDGNGLRPVATMGTDGSGIPELRWADGTTETIPDLDG